MRGSNSALLRCKREQNTTVWFRQEIAHRRNGTTRSIQILALAGGFCSRVRRVSWLVKAGIGNHGAPPSHSPPATFPPPGSTRVVACPSNELKVVGVYDECATAAPAKASACGVCGHMLDEGLRFAGDHQAFALELQIDGTYGGPVTYDLASWPRGLGTQDGVPKIAMFAIGVFCQSVSGVMTVTGGDGRSGTMNASLQTSNGSTVVPGPTIIIIGQWSYR